MTLVRVGEVTKKVMFLFAIGRFASCYSIHSKLGRFRPNFADPTTEWKLLARIVNGLLGCDDVRYIPNKCGRVVGAVTNVFTTTSRSPASYVSTTSISRVPTRKEKTVNYAKRVEQHVHSVIHPSQRRILCTHVTSNTPTVSEAHHDPGFVGYPFF